MKEGRVRGKELGRRSSGKWECKKTRFKKRQQIWHLRAAVPCHTFWKALFRDNISVADSSLYLEPFKNNKASKLTMLEKCNIFGLT